MYTFIWMLIFSTNTVISTQHNQHGKTPCCIDRLSTISCTRMALTKKKYFDNQCSNNADFALVQCCATCFDKREQDGKSKYETTVKRLITISNGNCADRRGDKWCKKMINREGFWSGTKEYMSCEMFPFAFRECRNSCGFCTTQQATTILKYNYTIASDSSLCSAKTFYAGTTTTTKNPFAKRFTSTTQTTRYTENLSSHSKVTEIPSIPISKESEESTTEIEPSTQKAIESKKRISIFTRRPITLRTTTEFDPLGHLNLEERREMTEDYFVAELTPNLQIMEDYDLEA